MSDAETIEYRPLDRAVDASVILKKMLSDLERYTPSAVDALLDAKAEAAPALARAARPAIESEVERLSLTLYKAQRQVMAFISRAEQLEQKYDMARASGSVLPTASDTFRSQVAFLRHILNRAVNKTIDAGTDISVLMTLGSAATTSPPLDGKGLAEVCAWTLQKYVVESVDSMVHKLSSTKCALGLDSETAERVRALRNKIDSVLYPESTALDVAPSPEAPKKSFHESGPRLRM
ncbi:MAG: hypothetical protein D6712_19975 [Chloroflexi bacterium]|nr:MAG: hypothetical protein D6712_19975 [Chloroflexota bacterium]